MLVVTDLSGVQRHPEPDLLRAQMHAVVTAKRRHQGERQRFHQQSLGYLGRYQDQHAITAILAIAVIPRDPRAIERLTHYLVHAVTDRHLMCVGAALVPEPHDVDDDDGSVNGQPLVPHLASTLQGEGRSNTCFSLPHGTPRKLINTEESPLPFLRRHPAGSLLPTPL
jgi:hypothetical protein